MKLVGVIGAMYFLMMAYCVRLYVSHFLDVLVTKYILGGGGNNSQLKLVGRLFITHDMLHLGRGALIDLFEVTMDIGMNNYLDVWLE